MQRLRQTLPALVITVLLSGCATQRSIDLPDLSDWETRNAILVETDEWEFSGRIGVSAGDEGFNGKIWWRQDQNVFRARLSGPLGAGTVFINGSDSGLSVTDRDGQVTVIDDPERGLRERYGWTIPVTSLRYWVLGIPDPASTADAQFEDNGELSRLTQRNWQVEIGQYRDGGGQRMPRRLTAVNDDVRVRLIIDKWLFR